MAKREQQGRGRKSALLASIIVSVAAIATIAVPSCRKAATAFDCLSVCAKYRDCIDIKYDVGACRARCRQHASADANYERKADACESCIRGHSCMGATFECGGQCLGVVP